MIIMKLIPQEKKLKEKIEKFSKIATAMKQIANEDREKNDSSKERKRTFLRKESKTLLRR